MSKKSGAEFDSAYIHAQVAGHEKMQELLKQEAKNSKDADLKAFAEKMLPTVEKHHRCEAA
jgi:putative membrane protein